MICRVILLCLIAVSTYSQRPNIIYIMSDDHDADAISAYNNKLINTPNFDRLANEGIRFTNCFVGNSICSPARATILTGQHSHMNGIKDNRTRFDSSKTTLPKILKASGYQTAMIGKWHLHSLPTGFDYWKIFPGQGQYYMPRMINMDNDTVRYSEYATKMVTKEAIGWLNDKRDRSKPFFLMMHHKAPHRNWVPELKWLEFFSKKIIPEPPTLYEDTAGKGTAFKHQRMRILEDMTFGTDLLIDPEYIKEIPFYNQPESDIRGYNAIMNAIPESDRLKMKEILAERGKILKAQRPQGKDLLKLKYQWYMQDYLACIASVDESVGELLDYLDKNGLTENTMIMYTSDQGFYIGENGWFDKRFMYDVSMQTPLMVRWKGKIPAGVVSPALIQNIDFAPTMLDVAGVRVPDWMQGLSIKQIITGKQTELPRKELYYHYYEYPIDHYVLPHIGIREKDYKLIYFYPANEWEFYDMKKDPDELHNEISNPAYQKEIERMRKRLVEIKKYYKDDEPVGELK